jgi:hypothetical protein
MKRVAWDKGIPLVVCRCSCCGSYSCCKLPPPAFSATATAIDNQRATHPFAVHSQRSTAPSPPPPPAAHCMQSDSLGDRPIDGLTCATRTLSDALFTSQVPRIEGILRSICSTGVLYTSSSTRWPEREGAAASRKKGRPSASVMLKLSLLKVPSCSCMIRVVCWGKQKRASTTAGATRPAAAAAARAGLCEAGPGPCSNSQPCC